MVWVIVLFVILTIAYAFIIESYKKHWDALATYRPAGMPHHTYISVIVAARNEEHTISRLLDSILNQDYAKDQYEIVIVDDHSDDGTFEIVSTYAATHPNVHLISLSQHLDASDNIIAFKKKAIETGIQMSKGQLIVTTDADCIAEPKWLSTINSYYIDTGAKCIAAPVRIDPGKSLLSVFQSLDFLTLQGITAAAVSSKLHMMCNGANFIYERKAFDEVNGFEGIDSIPSGDDMLLMQKIFELYPNGVYYLKSEEAIIRTDAAESWKKFFQQRIRWASKTGHYRDKKIFNILLSVYLYNVMFLIAAAMVMYFEKGFVLWCCFLLLKILIEYPFVARVASFFRLQRLMIYFSFMQPLHILYTIIAGFLGKFGSYEWKHRKVIVQAKANNS